MLRSSSFFVLACVLIGCGGAGASVPAESDLSEGRDAKPVTPTTPEDPAPVSPTTRFECQTGRPFYDGVVHTVTFALRGDTVEGDVVASPRGSLLTRLDDGATAERMGGKLVLRAGDRAELGLFENSDLTKGYVKVEGKYSDIFCTKSK